MSHQLHFMDAPPLARRHDPLTSHAAADCIAPKLSQLQAEVLSAYRRHGPMSARVAERLPEFASYGFSTVRKRISELHKLGELAESGLDTAGRTPCRRYRVREN